MNTRTSHFLAVALLAIAGASLAIAQSDTSDTKDKKPDHANEPGKVHVSVLPEEAYIWVDGKPVIHRSSTLKLSPGEHKIAVYNYGFLPDVRTITVVSGQSQDIQAALKRVDAKVSGPWGRIQIEGVPNNALVFLNGTTPEFFVGHADEMNNHIIGEQQLIVPVGTHQVHVLANKTEEQIWSGPVEVKENQRVVIYTKNQPDKQLVYKNWPEGEKLNALSRFEAGTASAKIAVAPVKGKLVVDRQDIKCEEPVKVSWQSTDAAVTTVKANDQPLAYSPTGQMETQPRQTTKYAFRAAGPGGIVTEDATVNVDPTVQTSLTPATPEIRYVKVGDKVEEQGSAELKWSATNANSVTIDPLGPVTGTGGSQTITAAPKQSGPGPVDETVTYKITATNVCGGSNTSTAQVHVTGSIEPAQVAAVEPPPELPATASPLPLLALLGLVSVGAGGVVRRTRAR